MSYLRYLNIYEDFNAGAGVMENELFTPDEKASFLPVTGTEVTTGPGTFFSMGNARDIRLLSGLVMLVLAINAANWLVALILLFLASVLIPLQYIVVAYCLCMQMIVPTAMGHFGLAIVCVILAIVVLFARHYERIDHTVLTVLYVLLALLFAVYVVRLPRAAVTCATRPVRVVPSFSDTY